MNFKRIISFGCALAMLTSVSAYATAMRTDIKQSNKGLDRSKPNDIIFQDFSSVGEGSFPTGVSPGSGSGIVTTMEYEVAPKYKKNCLLINDTSHDSTYSGIGANIDAGGQTGMVGVEIRYMYDLDPETTSTYSAMPMGLYDKTGKMISRTVIASSNGSTQFNYGGTDGKAMENSKVMSNTWYTAKWIIDFDKKKMDFSLLNEATNTLTTAIDAGFYENGDINELARVNLSTSMYGGKWVFDYVRISKETDRMSESTESSIKKGVEVEKIAGPVSKALEGRINISVDGRYKYTTEEPYAAENGAVMVTAKNLASFLEAGYVRSGNTYIIRTGAGILIINADSGSAVLEDKSVSLSNTEQKNNQLFVSAEEICDIFGYEYSYDSSSSTVFIKAAEEPSEETTEEGGQSNEN